MRESRASLSWCTPRGTSERRPVLEPSAERRSARKRGRRRSSFAHPTVVLLNPAQGLAHVQTVDTELLELLGGRLRSEVRNAVCRDIAALAFDELAHRLLHHPDLRVVSADLARG